MWNFTLASEQLKQEGRTPKWLADKCGVTRASIYLYLNGRRVPAPSVLKLMAMALNVTEAELSKSPGKAKSA